MKISSTNRVLLVDSDKKVQRRVSEALVADGHTIREAGNGDEAQAQLTDNVFQLVITALELSQGSGLDILRYLQEQAPNTPVIVTTEGGSVDDAVEAMRLGAFDFRQKPLNLDHLLLTVRRALEQAALNNAFYYLRHEQPYLYRLENITAKSAAMKQVLKQVTRVAPTNVTVLLTGETGTGKSLIAGAIHANSPRRENTLVTVNCAALSETLLESELFGHEKGAFTGAHKARVGRFQQAHGGTLFLDEVGEMSPGIQAKVLRAIEEQVIHRLGGSREIQVDVRIVAASNRDLWAEVERGGFRKDLYYRLNVAPLHMPSLRERPQDVLPLAERFIGRMSGEMNRPGLSLSPEAAQCLLAYDWPGNIRELRNVVERAVLFADGSVVTTADLGLPGGEAPAPPAGELPAGQGFFVAPTLNLDQLEKLAIQTALERCDWVQKDAARLLGISPRRISYKLDKLELTHPNFRARHRRG